MAPLAASIRPCSSRSAPCPTSSNRRP
jgi:hypothetical protein